MSKESIEAYEAIAGSATISYGLFAGVFATFLFIVLAWMLKSAHKGWSRNMVKTEELGAMLIRGAVLLLIVLFVVL